MKRDLVRPSILACLLALAGLPGCKVGYLLSSGYYQAELLLSRESLEEVQPTLSEDQRGRVDLIVDVKRYGAEIGLSATDNYGTLAQGWDRTIWNVSACPPLAFEPETWWFPIVGTVPYLGYFREEDAREKEAELLEEGLDVYVRTAGAYSTLGWFRDPILPGMLKWDDYALADTVLHELAHATLWVPGSVKFNESFASFVGQVAAMRYLAERRGVHDPTLLKTVQRQSDRKVYRQVLHELYGDLDAVYRDPALSDEEKAVRKAELLGPGLVARMEAAPFLDPAPYIRSAQQGPWNNARMVQFKVYSSQEDQFFAVLEQVDGDLLAFIQRIGEITEGRDDPEAAVAEAAASDLPAVQDF